MASPLGKSLARNGAKEVLKSAVVSVTSSKGALLLMLAGVQTGEIQAEFCSCAFESRKLAFFVVGRCFQWRQRSILPRVWFTKKPQQMINRQRRKRIG